MNCEVGIKVRPEGAPHRLGMGDSHFDSYHTATHSSLKRRLRLNRKTATVAIPPILKKPPTTAHTVEHITMSGCEAKRLSGLIDCTAYTDARRRRAQHPSPFISACQP